MMFKSVLLLYQISAFAFAAASDSANRPNAVNEKTAAVDVEPNAVTNAVPRASAPNFVAAHELSTEDKHDIVALHNMVRSATARGDFVGKNGNKLPSASDMNYVEWSESLATVATEWAEKCVFEHRVEDNSCDKALAKIDGHDLRGYSKGDQCGENIYISVAEPAWSTMFGHKDYGIHGGIADEWATDDAALWEYGSDGGRSGRFLQMIWSKTQFVGCGVAQCSGQKRLFLVCNYFPAANFEEIPYGEGRECSDCGAGLCTTDKAYSPQKGTPGPSWDLSGLCVAESVDVDKKAVAKDDDDDEEDVVELTELGEQDKLDIVALHNMVRSQTARGQFVGGDGKTLPSASNMKFLEWSESLARVATEWAEQCIFQHRSGYNSCWMALEKNGGNDLRGYSKGDRCGENLYHSSMAPVWSHNEDSARNEGNNGIRGGIELSWAIEEAKLWQYGSDYGQSGRYTQMIWADTQYVGCGVANCGDKFADLKKKLFLVCNYFPAGNYEEEAPYQRGRPCADCEDASCSTVTNYSPQEGTAAPNEWNLSGLCKRDSDKSTSANEWNPSDTELGDQLGDQLRGKDMRDLLALHNKVRSQTANGNFVGKNGESLPSASNMKYLEWSETLSQIASDWAKKCVFEHRRTSSSTSCGSEISKVNGGDISGYSKGEECGESLYLSYPEPVWSKMYGAKEYGIRGIEDEWAIEDAKLWEYSTCIGRSGRFTQMVWADTQYVGCGVAKCPDLQKKMMLVCNYYPSGNKDGETPYKKGVCCRDCAEGTSCSTVSNYYPQDGTPAPTSWDLSGLCQRTEANH